MMMIFSQPTAAAASSPFSLLSFLSLSCIPPSSCRYVWWRDDGESWAMRRTNVAGHVCHLCVCLLFDWIESELFHYIEETTNSGNNNIELWLQGGPGPPVKTKRENDKGGNLERVGRY